MTQAPDATWSVIVASHALAASVAVALGAWSIGHRPRGDRLHRRVGGVWAASMYWTALSSFAIMRLEPGHLSPLHLLSAWTVVSVTLGLRAHRLGRPRAHGRWMVGTYAGLLAAGVGAVAPPMRLVPRTAATHPWALAAGVIAALAISVAAIAVCRVRFAASGPRPRRR